MTRDEQMLVGEAKRLRFSSFHTMVAYWLRRADPDRADRDDETKRARRRVHLSETFGGVWVGDIVLDPISGTIVADQLARIDADLFAADWADAKRRLGRDPLPGELPRTAAQRRADALVEMAVRSATAPPGGRRPEPLFTVLVGYETFAGPICQLAGGAVLADRTAAAWLPQAWIERVVFDGPRRVIDVGVRTRLFTGALRRALEVRDRECFHPLCDEPAHRCQADHIIPYAAGGPTTQDNGRLACPHHNRHRHQRPPPDDP